MKRGYLCEICGCFENELTTYRIWNNANAETHYLCQDCGREVTKLIKEKKIIKEPKSF